MPKFTMIKPYIRHGLIISAVFGFLLLLMLTSVESKARNNAEPVQHHEWIPAILDVAQDETKVEVVQPGDTAGLVLSRLGFPLSEVANIIEASKSVYPLKSVNIGHKFRRTTQQGKEIVTYQVSADEELYLSYKGGEKWQAKIVPRHVTSRTVMVEGSIQDSLFYDAAKAGLADSLTMKLVDIFAWDIDFVRDLRKGDSFKVLYEESFDDEGKRVAYTILSAEFINKGHVYTAIRYEDKEGNIEYFDEEGRNLRKTYLKSPVKYSRISSRFSTARKHPVLGYTRAHRGVDYAAKSGTPIRAVGDGRVVFKGWKGGYGRFIEIRHNNGIHSTAYAHMRKYGKGIHKGSYVKQGQIIGYVGMSGLATGPHLHFEFRSRGRAVNPLKVKHKSAKPVPKSELTAFRLKAKEMMNMMAIQSKLNAWG